MRRNINNSVEYDEDSYFFGSEEYEYEMDDEQEDPHEDEEIRKLDKRTAKMEWLATEIYKDAIDIMGVERNGYIHYDTEYYERLLKICCSQFKDYIDNFIEDELEKISSEEDKEDYLASLIFIFRRVLIRYIIFIDFNRQVKSSIGVKSLYDIFSECWRYVCGFVNEVY